MMKIKVTPLAGKIIDRHLNETVRAILEDIKAVQQYNIMMGELRDPTAEEDTEDV